MSKLKDFIDTTKIGAEEPEKKEPQTLDDIEIFASDDSNIQKKEVPEDVLKKILE